MMKNTVNFTADFTHILQEADMPVLADDSINVAPKRAKN